MEKDVPVVYILDDDEGVRTSLTWLLGSVGIASFGFADTASFFSSYKDERVACLVLDVRMPETNGFEVQTMLNRRGAVLPVIFVSAHGDIAMCVRAMRNGAVDFVEKPYKPQEILERIQDALKQAARERAAHDKRQQLRVRLRSLTDREREVLSGVVEGKPSKVIARELSISLKTVNVHRAKIREKFGVFSTGAVVRDLGVILEEVTVINYSE